MLNKLIGLSLCTILLLAGCGNTTAVAQSESSVGQVQATQTVYGKIKSINGNELVVVMGSYTTQTPTAGANASGERPSSRPAQASGESGTQPNQSERQRPSEGTDQSAPEGGARQQQRQSGAAQSQPLDSGESQTGNLPDKEKNLGKQGFIASDEEKTYSIPVTATVSTGQGDKIKEISFTQLAVKNIVCLNLDDSGAIISVEVMA